MRQASRQAGSVETGLHGTRENRDSAFWFCGVCPGCYFPTFCISPTSLHGCFLLDRQTVDTISVD